MTRRFVLGLLALGLVIAACGGDSDEATSPDETEATEPDEQTTSTEAEAEETTSPSSTEPEEAQEDDAAMTGATLTIGGETWTFEEVAFCADPPEEPPEALVLIAHSGDYQLIVRVIDDSGEQRLEGDGVYDQIDFAFNPDPTQGVWMASSQGGGERFITLEDSTVTATASFDDLRTTEVEEIPGTLTAGCS